MLVARANTADSRLLRNGRAGEMFNLLNRRGSGTLRLLHDGGSALTDHLGSRTALDGGQARPLLRSQHRRLRWWRRHTHLRAWHRDSTPTPQPQPGTTTNAKTPTQLQELSTVACPSRHSHLMASFEDIGQMVLIVVATAIAVVIVLIPCWHHIPRPRRKRRETLADILQLELTVEPQIITNIEAKNSTIQVKIKIPPKMRGIGELHEIGRGIGADQINRKPEAPSSGVAPADAGVPDDDTPTGPATSSAGTVGLQTRGASTCKGASLAAAGTAACASNSVVIDGAEVQLCHRSSIRAQCAALASSASHWTAPKTGSCSQPPASDSGIIIGSVHGNSTT